MKIPTPKPAVLPLIQAIAMEISERCARILLLETTLDYIETASRDAQRRRLLVADIAYQRRELRHARGEMERLGFTIVGMDPLAVRVRPHRPSPAFRGEEILLRSS